MPKLFSYVVQHDHGFAPNPAGGLCTLVHCKFSKVPGKKNLVENAEEGDWILGTGGVGPDTAGNGRLIYLMRVDKKIPFARYLRSRRFAGRVDRCDCGEGNRFALVSETFYYLGANALPISALPARLRSARLEKKGPFYRCDLSEDLVRELVTWFGRRYSCGMHGEPCAPRSRPHLEWVRRYCKPAGTGCPTSARPRRCPPRW